jgi:hypothetical protein
MGTQKFRRLVEQVGQLGGLFLEAGEVDGRHSVARHCEERPSGATKQSRTKSLDCFSQTRNDGKI